MDCRPAAARGAAACALGLARRATPWQLPLVPAAHAAAEAPAWTALGMPVLVTLAGLGTVAAFVGLRRRRRTTADAALREAILHGTPETVIATDLERRIRVVNPAFTRLFGYAEADVQGRNSRMLYRDDADYERVGRTYRQRLDGTKADVPVLTVRFVAADGRVFHGDTYTDLLYDADANHVGYVGFIRDVSERVRAEAEYRTIFENTVEGLCRSTPDGRIVRANPALVRLFGYGDEAELCAGVTDAGAQCYVDPADRQRLIDRLEREDHVRDFEVEMVSPGTGERMWVSETARAVRNDAGEALYLDVSLQDITARRTAHDRLRAQEQRYRMLVEHAAAIFWEGDPDTLAFTFVSREAEDLLGYPRERWTDEPGFWVEHMHPDDRAWAPAFCREAIAEGREHEFDYRMIAADGRVVWLRDVVNVVCEDGRPVRNVGVMLDVTESREALEALASSERRYSELYHRTPVMMHALDREGRIVSVNDYWLEHLGYSGADVVGRRSVEFLTPDARREAEAQRSPELEQAGHLHNAAYQVVRADGSIIDVMLSAVADFDEAGHMGRVLAVMTDVTDQRRAEERLREAATVFDNTADGIFVTDGGGLIREVNRAFTQITGYTRDEVIGRDPRLWDAGRHDGDLHEEIWAAVGRHGHWRGEIWNRRRDDSVYPAWLSLSTVRGDAGETKGYVGVFSDISQVKDAEARLDHLAHHDSLTGLPNRLLLNDRIATAIRRSRRYDQRVALVFVDLDRFKHVNDSLGHAVGDRLLGEAARRFLGCVRDTDTVARIGGDEFALLLEDIDDDGDCVVVAEKVVGAFGLPFRLGDYEVFASASVGIAVYPDGGGDADMLLRNADAAMYSAKRQGGDTYAFYAEQLTARAHERVRIEGNLRHALDRGELSLEYQPQIDAESGRMFGVEALLRWDHPDMGRVSPGRFIGLAEETGLIIPIGDWVLREACRAGRALAERNAGFERVAVNVAGPQIRRGNLVDAVGRALDESGLAPSQLELEVTEGFIMERSERSVEVLHELRALGVRLAIDDFGTGYSSLAYLRRLPVGVLKIDQSFVHALDADDNAAVICRSVIALAGNLGLDVIGEGVETEAQCRFLVEAGCRCAQGFLFAPPAPLAELGVDTGFQGPPSA
mgnify:CR=1 FL=1